MIKLNKRLSVISAFIDKKDSVIDIGCDHGLLGIYLYQKYGLKMVSSDINEKPLEKAFDNLKLFNLENKIELRCGNGLDTLTSDIDTIIISGMGGINIINILKNIKNYPFIKKIIISPNTDFVMTRKKLKKLKFNLEKEEIVLEHGKYYLVSCYTKNKSSNYNNYFGKLDFTNKDVINYYEYIYKKNKKIIKNLSLKHFIKIIKLKIENVKIKNKLEIK